MKLKQRKRLELSGDFLLCLALLYYLDQDGLFLWLLLFCCLHELGHYSAIRLLGERVVKLRLSWTGMELRLSSVRPIPPKNRFWIALAGPAVNLILFFLCDLLARQGRGPRFYLLAGMNLALALFNLLPVRWLDGGQLLLSVFEALHCKDRGEIVLWYCSAACSFALLVCGLILFLAEQSFTLLLLGLWMFVISCKNLP